MKTSVGKSCCASAPTPLILQKKSGKTFVLVSGLPRSGTSLMMQMLQLGGLPPMTDGQRGADQDNPKGYYEWEAIKQIGKQPDLLDDESVEGKAIKVISMLLPQMPPQHDYKVIYMTRPIAEVAASQSRMIENLRTSGGELEASDLKRGLEVHRAESLRWIRNARHMELIEIDYPTLVADPLSVLPDLVEFVGRPLLPNHQDMANAIDPKLYRQQTPAPDTRKASP